MPPGLPFLGVGKLRLGRPHVSSAPYSPVVAGVRRNTHRVVGPGRPQLATVTPAASSAPAARCETDPVGVVTERLVRELPLCSCASSSAAHRRLDETNSAC